MPGATTKYAIPTILNTDAVNTADDTVTALAQRVDLLLGESGSWTIAMTANTVHSTTIAFGRTYPGNTGAAVPGILLVQNQAAQGAGVIVATWVLSGGWSGTATTITGVTLNAMSSTTASRTFLWRFLPCL